MVRPYAVKGKKRKKREEKYHREEVEEEEQKQDDEEEEEEEQESAKRAAVEKETMEAQGKEVENDDDDEEEEGGKADELEGIPVGPSDENAKKKNGVIFILEKASLEVAKVGKTYQLLNSDEHAHFLKRNNKDPAHYRPDIAHQALLSILDSPVNKAGRLKAVYVQTEKGVLFEVKPHVRLPRTFKRFSGMILQLLQQLKINASGTRENLLKVIKNPVTKYLPVNSRRIGFSYSSEKLVKMRKYVDTVGDDENFVFVVGAMSHGKIEPQYIDDYIAISGYPLSAAMCIARITEALADKWNIL